jgi:hypothetical protein
VNAPDDSPCFIDFEASSLGASSYPIEVAWSAPDGSIESHLVRPRPEWTDWSAYAEREIHRISRATLAAEGEAPVEVAARMNDALAGRNVYSDAPDFDARWLWRLFEGTGLEPAFRVAFLDAALVHPDDGDPAETEERVRRARLEASERFPRRHRAAWDVEFLLEWWRLATGNAGRG